MGLNTAKDGKLLYHLTRLSNLDSIIEVGLAPRIYLLDNNVSFGDVANPDIISKRTRLGLDRYTPFHFHPYSSFDVAVINEHRHIEFIYICIHRDFAKKNKFVVFPMHPLSVDECVLYDYDKGMELINWDTLMEVGKTNDYARQIKMAECLTDRIIPASEFQSIAVKNEVIRDEVEEVFRNHRLNYPPPYIDVQHRWF